MEISCYLIFCGVAFALYCDLHLVAARDAAYGRASLMDYGVNRRNLQQQVNGSGSDPRVVMLQVLGELKHAIKSDPFGVLDSWDVDNTDADPCKEKWSGLTCDAQEVELLALNLSGQQLLGTLAPSLSLLPFSSLTLLDLSQNNLSFSSDFSNLSSLIPPSLSHLNLSYMAPASNPPLLSTLLTIDDAASSLPRYQLLDLRLDGIHLSGPLPPDLGRTFPSLQALSLSHNNFTGSINAAVAAVLYLQYLDLSHNNLSGTLPDSGWCDIAGSNLSASLTHLDVSYNILKGIIPTALANCSALRYLDLSYNSLSGSIPAALPLSCRNLSFVSVIYNTVKLSGSLPPEFALLSSLESLLLEGNNFSGSPLPILRNCSALQTIHFFGNSFEGHIPSDFCDRLPNLSDLVLGSNFFSGPLPPTLANCSSFTNLMLGFNKFTGSISGQLLGKWTKLQRQLDLQYNSFVGSIPVQIGNLTNLDILILNNNNLSGSFPPEIGQLSALKGATFEYNSLSGNFPSQIFNCTGLMHLIIHHNHLQGPLPSSIGQVTQLSYLEAHNNLLTGNLPEALSNCTQLQNFSLGYNYFTGSIPPYLASLPNILFLFSLTHNNFSGAIPRGFGNMLQMQSLDLSHNMLGGQIPDDLWQSTGLLSLNLAANLLVGDIPIPSSGSDGLSALTLLNLSFNSLSGDIPSSIGQMPSLQTLDLSHNQLEGSIPSVFSRAPSLSFVDFSYNNLEGQVPTLPKLANASSASFLGNPRLCGEIVHRACTSGRTRKLVIIGLSVGLPVAALVLIFTVMVARKWSNARRQAKAKQQRLLLPILPASSDSNVMRLQLSEIERATHNFSSTNLIGTGATGSVYKGVMSDGQVLAFKRFTTENSSIHAFFRELSTTRQAKHRNLVKIFGYWSNHVDDNILILEYMPNGSLEDHLHPMGEKPRSCKFAWEERWSIAIAVAEGLLYLHEDCPNSPVVHGDIKPSNILLDSDMHACISDFGLAKMVVDMVTSTQNLHGTLGYIAPECATGQISPKSDVYSYGIVMLELMTGIRPSDTTILGDGVTLVEWVNTKAMAGSVREILDETLASMYDDGLCGLQIDLLLTVSLECASQNPRDRPSMNQLLARLANIKKIKNKS